MSSFPPQSWRCFRAWVGIALAIYSNAAGLLILQLRTSQAIAPRTSSLLLSGFLLSIGAFFFAVVLSGAVREVVLHPDRRSYYQPRDLMALGAFFTLPGLLNLVL